MVLHALWLSAGVERAAPRQVPPVLRATLRPVSAGPALPPGRQAAPAAPGRDAADPERDPARPRAALRREAPAVPAAVLPAAGDEPPGSALAEQARQDMRGVWRDMQRQEGFLDPKRGRMAEPPTLARTRDAIAAALEKQFGRPLPFVEESTEVTLEGGRLWRIRTEQGAVCLKELPPNVMLSAPGQGLGKTLLVPMLCD